MAQSIDIKKIEPYLTDDRWVETQKLDGFRLLLDITDGKVRGINRSGSLTSVDRNVAKPFEGQAGHWVFDGELIGSDYWIFDMPVAANIITPATPYAERRELMGIIPETNCVHVLPVATTTVEKVRLAQRCVLNHAEGVMFNRLDGPYVEGQRSQYLLKAKLVETVDVVVTEVGRENKRSIGVAVYEDGKLIEVGSVKVSDRMLDILQVGEVIEAKYLYVGEKRKLYQPSFLRRRPDRTPESCLISQLKVGNKEVLT